MVIDYYSFVFTYDEVKCAGYLNHYHHDGPRVWFRIPDFSIQLAYTLHIHNNYEY